MRFRKFELPLPSPDARRRLIQWNRVLCAPVTSIVDRTSTSPEGSLRTDEESFRQSRETIFIRCRITPSPAYYRRPSVDSASRWTQCRWASRCAPYAIQAPTSAVPRLPVAHAVALSSVETHPEPTRILPWCVYCWARNLLSWIMVMMRRMFSTSPQDTDDHQRRTGKGQSAAMNSYRFAYDAFLEVGYAAGICLLGFFRTP